jgi:demethylmenaquinone methyltransferase/2-methoxy-6-polyprenyl-1,4-benzoquinol methylase
MIEYYNARAEEYDSLYNKPERQIDLAWMKQHFKKVFKDKRVLEVACGTGYWTQCISESAQSILATDLSPAVLEVAGKKTYRCPVDFELKDLFELQESGETFDAVFAGFIVSHIEVQALPEFANALMRVVSPGGILVLTDNRMVPGSNTPISRTDAHGNTYQQRTLTDGRSFEVLKNFISIQELEQTFSPYGHTRRWSLLEHYFIYSVIRA